MMAEFPSLRPSSKKIEREQAEAKNRDTLYRGEQLKINRQQLKVNSRLMIFTGLLVLTSVIGGGISIYRLTFLKSPLERLKMQRMLPVLVPE